MPDRSHLLPAPLWMLVLRGVQLVLGIIILGLAAYGINYFPFGGGFDGINLTMYAVSLEAMPDIIHPLSFAIDHRDSHYCSLYPHRNACLPVDIQLLGHPRSRCSWCYFLAFFLRLAGFRSVNLQVRL